VLIAFVTLIAGAAALASSATREPTYEASAQVLVSPIPETERSLPQVPLLRASSDRTRVIQTAGNLLDSPEASALTARRLGSSWTADQVAAMVDVLPEGESDILAITAKAADPDVAARVANEFARSALEVRGRTIGPILDERIASIERDLEAEPDRSSPAATDLAERLASLRALRTDDGDPTLSLTQRADPPAAPVGPSRAILVIVSVFAGLAVGLGVALVLDMLTPRRVADASQAVAASGLPVLARVPALAFWQRVHRAGPLRFRPAAAAAFRTLQHQLELRPGAARRILFAGGSSGDGVTTSVAELGLTLARAGHEVLVVDLDARNPQLAAQLGVSHTTLAGLAGNDEWESAIATVPGAHGLKLLAVGAHGPLGIPEDIAAELREVLAVTGERFDYVLIDAPPLADSAEALRVSVAVDAVVLVVRPGRTRLLDLETTLDVFERVGLTPAGLLLVSGRAPAPPGDPAGLDAPTDRPRGGALVNPTVET